MSEDIILNINEVESPLKKIISYIERESDLIEEFSNLVLHELDTCYKSNLNNKIDAIGIAITSRLNNIYKEDLDSYMFVKDLVTRTEEAKRINIRNTISEEENLHG